MQTPPCSWQPNYVCPHHQIALDRLATALLNNSALSANAMLPDSTSLDPIASRNAAIAVNQGQEWRISR
ncbi:MAG: hypothetical protein IGR92_11080 [Leptolyngbyaceae cyanobacterium T60_A2020_046]|nr:hypothetical protein [Leptolyngbyaceae cyanobacterium T60_A2020_046]